MITNLLDDAILQLFRQGGEARAERALPGLLSRAATDYEVRTALVTCVGEPGVAGAAGLAVGDTGDEDRYADGASGGAGGFASRCLATFPPGLEPTVALLRETAGFLGRDVEFPLHPCEGACDALRSGDSRTHHAAVTTGGGVLREQGDRAMVLAQVSMVGLRPALKQALGLPVFYSRGTSPKDGRNPLRSSRVL